MSCDRTKFRRVRAPLRNSYLALALATCWLSMFCVRPSFAEQFTAGNIPQIGHSGAWYNPDRNGEGWILEITDPDRATLFWYTFENGT